MILSIILFILGLALVVKSADYFLSAAEKIGITLRLPAFVLGVILVGFGTSLPELTTSIASVIDGQNAVAISNITGSNIANILIIIGFSTIAFGTIKFEKNLIDLDLPLLISTTTLFALMIVDGKLNLFDGLILLTGFAGYLLYSLYYKEDKALHSGLISFISKLSKKSEQSIESQETAMTKMTIVIAIASVASLAVGSKITVDNLLVIVKEAGIAVDVISFFALAIGTSLPELVVSIKAHKKGQGDLIVGNIIGSNMFNILLIGGVAGVISPQVISTQLIPWTIVGLGTSVLFLTVGGITRRIHIWEGFNFLLVYVVLSSIIISTQ